MKVLVTRAQPAASRTAEGLKERGHQAVLMPLFECIDTGIQMPESGFDGLIFTSANAPRILHMRGWHNHDPAMPAFCVGRTTGLAALNLGFQKVTYADGGGANLAEEILHHHHHDDLSALLYPTTPDRQFDMQAALDPHGIDIIASEIYQMQALEITQQDIQNMLDEVQQGAILVYSRQSADMLINIIKKNSAIEILYKTRIIAISKHAALPFEAIKHQNIYISDVPNEISMFHILDKLNI